MDEIREPEDPVRAQHVRGNTRGGIRDSWEGRCFKEKNRKFAYQIDLGLSPDLDKLFSD